MKTLGAMRIFLLIVVAYILSSGPVGGLVCFALKESGLDPRWLIKAYLWHLAVYKPLLWMAGELGLDQGLLAYWHLFGWEYAIQE